MIMSTQLQRLAPVARTVAWPALLGGAAACIAVIALGSLAPGLSPKARWPGLGALALCAGAAFLLDDSAASMLAASPRSLARRRMLRIALALPLLCGVWAASLWYATTSHGAPLGPGTRGALSLQFAAMLTLTLAASAMTLRVMADEHGGWTAIVVPVALLGAVMTLPQRWALLAAPGDDAWHAAQQRWTALLALGLLLLIGASRDPVARNLSWRARRTPPATPDEHRARSRNTDQPNRPRSNNA